MSGDDPIRVMVASTNPVKIHATQRAFTRVFSGRDLHIEGVVVESGVSDQPMTGSETLSGARNRAMVLADRYPGHDFVVGIEGGIEKRDGELEAFAWVIVRADGREGRSQTASFLLPPEVCRHVEAGMELGDANDAVFGTENSKHEQGAVGLMTRNLIDRTGLYEPAVILALIPFQG